MKVNLNRLNKRQKEIVREECVKHFDTLVENMNRDVFIQMAHYFHFKCGYGQKRLETLVEGLKEALDGIHARYELSESDTSWVCEKKLKEDGIDVERLLDT